MKHAKHTYENPKIHRNITWEGDSCPVSLKGTGVGGLFLKPNASKLAQRIQREQA